MQASCGDELSSNTNKPLENEKDNKETFEKSGGDSEIEGEETQDKQQGGVARKGIWETRASLDLHISAILD